MSKQGTYYIGRVIKLGLLNQDKLIEAIKSPIPVRYRGNAWTFIDVEEYNQSGHHYIFGRLAKYSPEGEVTIVDTVSRSERTQIEPNLKIASSPFVYIPEHSGIAFLNVYSHIEPHIFIKRFTDIVINTHHGFFVDCEIELISDLKTFAAKLISLDGIFHINASISPPNPLFSPLWEPLEKYLRKRNTDRMKVSEDSPEGDVINTDLPELVKKASEQTEDDIFIPESEIEIGDAAILMAADGYGNGVVKGKRENELVVIRTSETSMNFSFDKEPIPYELYLKSEKILENIRKYRHMEHGDGKSTR